MGNVTKFLFGNFSLLVLFLSVVAMVHCYCCYRFFRLLWLCMYYICMMICFFFKMMDYDDDDINIIKYKFHYDDDNNNNNVIINE